MKTKTAKTGPLDQAHLDMINANLRALHDSQDLLARCVNCGLDVTEYKAEYDRQTALFTALKQEFFPGQ